MEEGWTCVVCDVEGERTGVVKMVCQEEGVQGVRPSG